MKHKNQKFAGPPSVLGWFQPPTTDQKPWPQAIELQLWGGFGTFICGYFCFVFRCKKTSSFLLPKCRKNEGFGRPKWLPKLDFSNFGGHWFQTLVFQVLFSILLPCAWEILLWIFNICSPKRCTSLSFVQVLLFCSQMRVFEGGAKILRFEGLKSFKNPLKIYENRMKNACPKQMTF